MDHKPTSLTSINCWPADAIPKEWIEKLFTEMSLTFGKKFHDQWAGINADDLKRHWAKAMFALTNEEMKRGVIAMREREWPPTLPEFLKLCKPPAASTDAMKAYYEALAGIAARERGEVGEWSHPAIYWASAGMAFDLKTQTYSQMKARWEAEFLRQMQLGEWSEIPQPMLALPEPGKSDLSRDNAAKMVSSLKADGMVKVAEEKTDHRRWAKLIIERIKRGDKTVTMIQKRFATEAIAAPDV